MRIAVLGVGLIGGSIGLAARRRAEAEVCGYDPDAGVRAKALELGAIDEQAQDVREAVAGADVVFVADPVGALVETVGEALANAGADCVLSDVGSTKRLLSAAGADGRFIGGHPLAGAETAGVEHARENLFDGATWYLTPAKGATTGVLYERLHGLLRRLGANPSAIDADTHDRMMACVSHLPHVLANLLASQAAGTLAGDAPEGTPVTAQPDGHTPDGAPLGAYPFAGHRQAGEAQRLPAVGPSFRDAIRVAGANSAIWTDIYISNRDALTGAIDELSAGLAAARERLAAADAPALTAWNDAARADRDALLGTGAAGGSIQELRVSVPNRPGVVADIALALGQAGVNIRDMALAPSEDNRQGVVALWIGAEAETEHAERLIAALGFPVARA